MSKHTILNARWQPINAPTMARMRDVLLRWEDTPYRSGGSLCGVEADCIGSVFGVIDDLDGRERRKNSDMPHDTALHNQEAAFGAVSRLRHIYEPAEKLEMTEVPVRPPLRSMVQGYVLEPGDLLVVGTSAGGPGHLMIVGPQENTIWHSVQGQGFRMGGWGLGDGWERLFAAYRLGDRERWTRAA